MSRKTVKWRKILRQTKGSADPVIPRSARGRGVSFFGKDANERMRREATCTMPMGEEKESRIRQMAARVEKELMVNTTKRR